MNSTFPLFKNLSTTMNPKSNSSLAIQPLLYYEEKTDLDGIEIFGRVCIFIQYMIIFPIFALFLHVLFKFVRKTVSEQIGPEMSEIVENVKLSSLHIPQAKSMNGRSI